ncbi:MAG: hypothetical protein KFW07_00905 [Mycoplasmataceae bacterium]|nr:hypothetical protein [Mycoplasmataceae bacterium]
MSNKIIDKRVSESFKMKDKKSDSIYYPLNLLKQKKLKFFDFDIVKNIDNSIKHAIDKYINLVIINLEKNVGKTFWMIGEMNDATNKIISDTHSLIQPTDYFLWIFRDDASLKSRRNEINNDPFYEFYIKGSSIYSKGYVTSINKKGREEFKDRGIFLGIAIGFSVMHNASSNQYNNFNKAYYDEYRSKTSLPRNVMEVEVPKFITLISNFQRSKKEIKFFLFGNNEAGPDLIAEYLGIQKDIDYYINLEMGILYMNTGGVYSGIEDDGNNAALRFSKNSSKISSFLSDNISMETIKGICPKDYFEKSIPWGYFFIEGKIFKVSIYKEKKWLVERKEEDFWNNDISIPTFGYLTKDWVHSSRIIKMNEEILEMFATLYKFNLLLFWSIGDRNSFSIVWDKIMKQNKII